MSAHTHCVPPGDTTTARGERMLEHKTPPGYAAGITAANLGLYAALMTPVVLSLSFKFQGLVGEDRAANVLAMVTGAGALCALIANPLMGQLSDRTRSRHGMRRPWILGGTLGGVAALTVVGISTSIPVILGAWCLAQVAFNAVLAAMNATIPDQVPLTARGRISGFVGMAVPVAVLLGVVVVRVVETVAFWFILPAAAGAIPLILFGLRLRDRTLDHTPAPFRIREFLRTFYFNPVIYRDFGWTWLTKFLVNFGYAGVATFLPLYLVTRWELDKNEATEVILISTLLQTVAMLVSSPLGGILSDRIGKRRPFVTAAGLIMVVGLVTVAAASTTTMIIVGKAIIGLGAGAFISVDTALATSVLPTKDNAAKDLGVLNMANALPQMLAPTIAPVILLVGDHLPWGRYPTWYLFGALIALTGAGLVYRIRGVK